MFQSGHFSPENHSAVLISDILMVKTLYSFINFALAYHFDSYKIRLRSSLNQRLCPSSSIHEIQKRTQAPCATEKTKILFEEKPI